MSFHSFDISITKLAHCFTVDKSNYLTFCRT